MNHPLAAADASPSRTARCALVVAFVAVQSAAAFGQGPAPARAPVDVRSMLPSPQQPDAFPPAARSASGLTRDQRKEAALKARDERALKPAGEAAELRDERAAPVAVAKTPAPAPNPPAVAVAAAPSPPVKATSAAKTKKKAAKPKRPVKAAPV